MSLLDLYRSKRITAEAAAGLVESGHRIYVSGNAATPTVFLEALAARRKELAGVELVHVLQLGPDPFAAAEMEGHFRRRSLFVGPADRDAVNAGRADYVPVFLHEIPKLFREGHLPLDAAILQVSPPDEHGFLSLGCEVIASKAAIEAARTVIAIVNERMPRTLGDTFLHVSRIGAVVEVDRPLPELAPAAFGEVEARIGRHVAALIEDGATLQLGIGGIPNAVLASLEGRRDIGIHTEMLSDGIVELIDRGIATGAKKTLHAGKAIGTFVLGSERLYRFVHDNPAFELHPVDYVNDPYVASRNDRLVAINSALEVDLTGQVCADSIGTRIYSGFGGQLDFIRAASRSKGGRPIIALPSTARGGAISRIVPALQLGAGVVTTRADVHYVVTEHGVAQLFGRSLRERALALIEVADPKFRAELARAAEERGLLGRPAA
jgi:4-hydroxybutyrate CoA-transferase